MPDPILHGVFIEPDAELDKFIRTQKKVVSSQRPGEAYTDHPPHATLIVGAYHSPDIWLELLEDLVLPAFDIQVVGYHVFENDAMACGGHTVVHRIQLSEHLVVAQRAVAEVLADFVECATPNYAFNVEPMRSSQERYGFPFIGEHWIPHMTVASINGQLNDPLIEDLLSEKCRMRVRVEALQVWRVENERHEMVARLPLI